MNFKPFFSDDMQLELDRLPPDRRNDVIRSAEKCILIEECDNDASGSEFGGDLAFECDGVLLPLVAEIHLIEIPANDWLPGNGRLLVFADTDPDDLVVKNHCCIVDDSDLLKFKSFLAFTDAKNFDVVRVSFRESLSFPEVDFSDSDADLLYNLELRSATQKTRLFGHSSGDVEQNASSARIHDLAEWRVLLQIDSHAPLARLWCWDNGKLQILIRESDLRRQRFDDTVGVIVGAG